VLSLLDEDRKIIDYAIENERIRARKPFRFRDQVKEKRAGFSEAVIYCRNLVAGVGRSPLGLIGSPDE
jgi:hypothetical protein